MGGEGVEGGSGNVVGNGNGVVVPGSLHQPAPPAVAVAASGGGGGGAGLGVEKVKFTVSVRGHQWSSARHVNETLEEFAAAIQRNARRLEFIDEDDSIQRLQLAYSDGSEPEDLDVDATLGDVIICMGDKQLLAIVNSTKPPRAATIPGCNGSAPTRPETENRSPLAGKCKTKLSDSVAPSSYNGPPAATTNAPDLAPDGLGHKFMQFPPYKPAGARPTTHQHPRIKPASAVDPSRALKINIPPDNSPSVPFQEVDRSSSGQFHPEYVAGSSLPPLGPSRANGKVAMGAPGAKAPSHCGGSSSGQTFCNNNHVHPTPTPAELANMLVRSSSHPHRMGGNPGGNFGPGVATAPPGVNAPQGNRSSPPPPNGGFASFTNALINRVPNMPNPNVHGASTNIALLAQFLASQLRAFVPNDRGAQHPPPPAAATDGTHPSPCRENRVAPPPPPRDHVNPRQASNGGHAAPPPRNSAPAAPTQAATQAELKRKYHAEPTLFENGSPKPEPGSNNKIQSAVTRSGSHETDESSSSANVANTAVAPSSGDGVDSAEQTANGGTEELVFLVNRRSKTGVGTHHLKMSDLSAFFHLSVVDAAKKLGVSQTTLKKACRKFGLKRWPGRKVRSLESTIHGLEHTIAVGQGAGLEELTEAYMRSEVSKLQQEMDQLVHGTPAQHSPAVRTADLYKRLYSRGWRSKYHSPGRHDINIGNNHENRTSGLAPPSGRKANDQTPKVAKANGGKGAPRLVPKDEPVQNQPNKESSRPSSRDTVMKGADIEGLLKEPASKEANNNVEGIVAVPVDNGVVVNGTKKTTSGEKPCDMIVDEKENGNTFAERSPKRPKRECRMAAERRSNSCAGM